MQDFWTAENPNAKYPAWGDGYTLQFDTHLLENASFLRLKNLVVGFNGRAAQPGAVKDEVIYTTGDGSAYASKSFPADDPHWQWPIPSHDRQINDNLVQNPGY